MLRFAQFASDILNSSRCKILHRDISEGNIMITDEGEGLLIDWDMSIRRKPKQDSSNVTSVCRDGRTVGAHCSVYRQLSDVIVQGTWQFMSAKLLRDRGWTQDEVDNRESAFWVMIWVALYFMPSKPKPGSDDDVTSLIDMFDDKKIHRVGTISGGNLKMMFLQF